MNLITDPWIPIHRANGKTERIVPWELTDRIDDNPILAVASPRPDFDGALTQFLIGLLQTTCTPSEDQWWDWHEIAPSTEELKVRFETVAHAFELEGGKAFMQDFNPEQLEKRFDIAALLIGSPPKGSSTDLFIKQDAVEQLCPHCAAAALFALQTQAPEGGRGYRTGMRGGGPLTTLVVGKQLWDTCWLNVLEASRYHAGAVSGITEAPDHFPWLAPTRTSESKPPAGVTTPVHVHPDQQFWSLPRRIRLVGEECELTPCDLCGTATERIFRSFLTRNYGVNYDGFEHPLSPHYKRDATLLPAHPGRDGIGYRDWLGLTENSPDGSHRPARVVTQFRNLIGEEGRLWAFGYDMDSNKARCWYEARMPILFVPPGCEDTFRKQVDSLVKAAEKVAGYLYNALKAALFGQTKIRGDLGSVKSELWKSTEAAFYPHVRDLRDAVQEEPLAHLILDSWHRTLRDTAFVLFDRYSRTGDFDAVDPGKIATARNSLGRALGGVPLKKILGLPKPPRKKSTSP